MTRKGKEFTRGTMLCAALGCDRAARSGLYCGTHYSRLQRGSKAGLRPINKKCLQCGKGLTKNRSRFCSHLCTVRFFRGTPNFKICIVCGKRFEHPGTNSKCCGSVECREQLEA